MDIFLKNPTSRIIDQWPIPFIIIHVLQFLQDLGL